jgi:glycerophosphoryl diester phosphodiesterase
VKRVGHKGADLIAPGNTLESFDAALAAGVDMVEFDVLPEHRDGSGRLVLAHDYSAFADRVPLTLEQGLAHFAADAYAGVELDLDLKLPGYEERVVAALRAHGLAERTLISTMEYDSLRLIRSIAPEIRLGWSVPKLRRNPLQHAATKHLAMTIALGVRRILPIKASRRMRAGEIDALMCHFALVSPALVRAIERAGGELYVWTVDEAPRIEALRALGVSGVITNDPRLFGTAPASV